MCLWEMRRMDNWNPYGAGPRQFGSIVLGAFGPVLAKHGVSFTLIDMLAVGVELSSNVHRIRPVPGGWSPTRKQS
jgi:hypothetical protein